MSKQLAVAARARALLGHIEPLVADLPTTLRRRQRYRGMRGFDAYYAQLYSEDIDLLRVDAADSPRLDRMIRRVSAEFPAWSGMSVARLDDVVATEWPALIQALCSHPDGHVREGATRWISTEVRPSQRRLLVLRCIDPVPAVREVARAAVEEVLRADPMDLRRTDYAVLQSARARRLVPELSALAAHLQATDPYVRRRDAPA